MNFLQNDENVRITEDGFIWKIVTHEAKKLYINGTYELFVLYDDSSDSLLETFQELYQAIEQGLKIGIKVGKLNIQRIPDLTDLFVKKKDESTL